MRYFVFFYTMYSGPNVGYGKMSVMSKKFPSDIEIRNFAVKDILKENPSIDVSAKSVVITGWNEMTKQDFDDFTNTAGGSGGDV